MAKISKKLIILANSIRIDPNRCIAGRELNDKSKILGWIRPVSNHGNGELSKKECTLTNGHEVAVLDIVKVHLSEKQDDRLQPENWIINPKMKWERIGKADVNVMNMLVENPSDIWEEKNARLDSVSSEFIMNNPPSQSLYLIKPKSLDLQFFREDMGQYGVKKRRRAVFVYNKRRYDLAITDPSIEDRYKVTFPKIDAPPVEINLGNNCYTCLSLAHEPVSGRHYKLMAAIIPPDMFKT